MPIEFWNFHYMFLVIWLTICKHILQNILIYRGAVYHQDHKVIFIVQQKFFFYILWWNVFIIWLTICKHVLQNIFIYKGAVYHQDQKIIFTRQQKFFFFFCIMVKFFYHAGLEINLTLFTDCLSKNWWSKETSKWCSQEYFALQKCSSCKFLMVWVWFIWNQPLSLFCFDVSLVLFNFKGERTSTNLTKKEIVINFQTRKILKNSQSSKSSKVSTKLWEWRTCTTLSRLGYLILSYSTHISFHYCFYGILWVELDRSWSKFNYSHLLVL